MWRLLGLVGAVVLATASALAQQAPRPPEAEKFILSPTPGSVRVETAGTNPRFDQRFDWTVRYTRPVAGNDNYRRRIFAIITVWKFKTRDGAIAECTRLKTLVEQARDVPPSPRIRGYDCFGARLHDTQMTVGGSFNRDTREVSPGYQQRSAVLSNFFSRGVFWVSHSYVSDSDTALGPPLPFPEPNGIDELAAIVDTLDSSGKSTSTRPPAPPQTAPAPPPGATSKSGDAPVLTKPSRDLIASLRTPEGQVLLAALGASAVSVLGALLAMTQSGVPAGQALSDLGNLMRGRLPPDGYAEWLARQQAAGNSVRVDGRLAYVEDLGRPPPLLDPFRDLRGRMPAGATSPPAPPRDGEANPQTGEVWSDEDRGWVSRNMYEWEQRNRREIQRIADYNRTAVMSWEKEAQELGHRIAENRARQQAAADEEARRRQWLTQRLQRAYADEGRDAAAVSAGLTGASSAELQDMYGRHLRAAMQKSSAEAAYNANLATALDVGYYASKVVLAGAKTGLVVAGGPMGAAVSIGASGLITGVEEGTTAYLDPAGGKSVVGSFATGFLSGVKDGAIGRYTNLPGTSTLKKVLLPAVGDAGEMYLRTGDGKKSLQTGLLSAAGGVVGLGTGRIENSILRGGVEDLTGGVIGGAQTVISGGSFSEGFTEGLVDGIGAKAGGHITASNTPMSRRDVAMDAEYAANQAKARQHAAELDHAIRNGSPEDKAKAVKAVLDHRESRQWLKNSPDEKLKADYAALVDQNRTQPLVEGAVNHLNSVTMQAPDGTTTQRYGALVTGERGTVLMPLDPAHLKSGSGSAGSAPGMDLDLYAGVTIFDKQTRQPVKPEVVGAAVDEACKQLGINPKQQEINFVHKTHAEAFALRPGEDPKAFIARGGSLTGREGQSVTEVTGFKLNDARLLHGSEAGGSAVSEMSRIAIKDTDRLTQKLLETHPDARLPEVFTRIDATTGETPLAIMRKVGEGELAPGTGNARFRAITGMSLESGSQKLASLPEFIAKGVGAGGEAPATPGLYYRPGTHSSDITSSVLREAMRTTLNRREP
jgi:hypothetical protein